MSLLPVPRPEEWEHIDLAEAHALALHAPLGVWERVEGLLQLVRLAALRQLPQRARRILADVDTLLAGVEVPVELTRSIDAERLWMSISERGDVAEVAVLLDDGLVQLDACGPDELATRARLLFCIGYSAAWLNDPARLTRAVDWLGESVGLYRVLDEPELQAQALLTLGYIVYPAQRLYGRAITALERSVRLLPLGSSARGVHLTYLAEQRIIIDDLVPAEAELREAHALGGRHGDQRLIGYAAWELARIADLRGDAVTCDRWIAEAEHHGGEWYGRTSGNEFVADTVLWAYRQGRADAARDRYRTLAERGDRITEGQDLGARGLVALLDGDPRAGAELIQRHLDLEWQEPRKWHWQILLADAWLQAGESARATRLAAQVRDELSLLGLTWLASRREPARWARVSAALEPDIAAVRLEVFTVPTVVSGGQRRILPDGRPAALAGLLAVAGHALSIEEVCDELWPDAAPTIARRRLRNVMARVRAAAGHDLVQRVSDGLRLDPALRVDCVDFERAARTSTREDGVPSARELRSILDSFGEGLLPGVGGERIEAHRRRLAHLATGVRRRLVDVLRDAEDPDAAAAEAERVLADDPFDEELAVSIARAYAMAGNGAAARVWEERARSIAADLEL